MLGTFFTHLRSLSQRSVVQKVATFFALCCIALVGTWPLLHSGLYTAHDIWHQTARFFQYQRALGEGQFPPIWISYLAEGYGYPLFLFSYHLPWLIGAIPLWLTHDLTFSLKLLYGLSYLFSGLAMYGLSKRLFHSRAAALLTTVLYLWAPFRFLTLYVSAALGFAWVFVGLPLLWWGLLLARDKPEKEEKATYSLERLSAQSKMSWLLIAAGSACIVLSHLIMAALIIPATICFVVGLFLSHRIQSMTVFIRNVLIGGLLGFGLSAFYLIPAMLYSSLTQARSSGAFADIFKGNFVNFSQLIYSKWGFGPIVSDAREGEISLQLGLAQWAAVLSAVPLLIWGRKKLLALSLLAGTAVCLSMMLPFSEPVWAAIGKVVAVDYPFRLLLPATLLAALLGGLFVVELRRWVLVWWSHVQKVFAGVKHHKHFNNKNVVMFSLLSALSLWSLFAYFVNRNHIRVNLYWTESYDGFIASETTTNTFHEYLPREASSELFSKPYQLVVPGTVQIVPNTQGQTSVRTSSSLEFVVKLDQPHEVLLGQYAFPGIETFVDGEKATTQIGEKGLIKVVLQPGTHTLRIHYQPPLIIRVAQAATTLTLLFTIWLWYSTLAPRQQKSKKKKE